MTMDTLEPQLAKELRRRRRQRMFSRRRIPVRLMIPNFFTLLGLCAGLTSIRMGIDGRYDIALAAIVFAAFLDGIDGRVARLLKASSRFGAELDSLADFVNFGVAPAFLLFNWGLGTLKSFGWICVMMFALASALRLARFNAALDEDRPKWQSNYFSGMPTPAAAIVVMLPIYLEASGLVDIRGNPSLIKAMLVYILVIGVLMVSTVPTYSGKLIGERIGREWVLPAIFMAIGFVALLVTYTYETLVGSAFIYLASIVWSYRRYQGKLSADEVAVVREEQSASRLAAQAEQSIRTEPPGESLH
jgi:CDP-diacylglycerol---serine O-phosphatidyltransferase